MKARKLALSAITAAIALSGCSSTHSPSFERVQKDAKELTGESYEKITDNLSPLREHVGLVYEDSDIIDVNSYTVIPEDNRVLPRSFDETFSVKKVNKDDKYTLRDLASALYHAQRIIVDTSSPDLVNANQEESGSAGQTSSGLVNEQGVTADVTGVFSPQSAFTATQPASTPVAEQEFVLKPIEFLGTIRELLDYVAISNNIKWRYDEKRNRVYFFRYEVRKFFVYDFTLEQKYESVITNETSSDTNGTSAGSNKSLTNKEDLTPWKDIETTVNQIKSEQGKASFDPKSGMITVRDNDYALSQIEDYIEDLNKTSTTEIIVEFRMINAKVTETNYKGINVNYLNSRLKNKALGSFAMDAGIGSMSPDVGGNLAQFQELVGGNYLTFANDTFSALMGMINTVGTAKVGAYEYITMMNNDTYNSQNSKNREYISSMEKSSSTNSDGRDNISTETDVAVDGMNISIKARVAGDQVLIDYSVASSMFDGFVDAGLGSGLEGVKLKNDSTNDIKNKAQLRNGETRILLASSKVDESSNTQGLLDEMFWWLGGNEQQETQKDVTFVTVTAYYNN